MLGERFAMMECRQKISMHVMGELIFLVDHRMKHSFFWRGDHIPVLAPLDWRYLEFQAKVLLQAY